MTKITQEQAALARDDLDQLHGKGRWAGDASNWCLHDGIFAASLPKRYGCGNMAELIDAVDDAYRGRAPWTCHHDDCERPAIPRGLRCPRHTVQAEIEQERGDVPQAAVTEMLTKPEDIDKFLADMVTAAGPKGLRTRFVMRQVKDKVHVSMHGYAVVHIIEKEWLRL